jgi:hypothetical protein
MTTRTDERPPDAEALLRELYREDLGTRPGADTHPSEDDWVALTTGSLAPDVRERIVDHVVECDECAAIHRALTDVRREAAAIDPGAPALADASSPWWPRYGVLAAAALVLVALGGALWVGTSRNTTDEPAASIAAATPGTVPAVQGPAAGPRASALPPWAASVVALDVRMPPALTMTLRGEASAEAARRLALVRALRPALDLYRDGAYAQAAAALTPLARAHADEPEVAFYAGLSHLLADDASSALPLLGLSASSDLVGEDAQWFTAVAHERLGAHDRAAETLRALCAPGGPRSREACEALQGPSR